MKETKIIRLGPNEVRANAASLGWGLASAYNDIDNLSLRHIPRLDPTKVTALFADQADLGLSAYVAQQETEMGLINVGMTGFRPLPAQEFKDHIDEEGEARAAWLSILGMHQDGHRALGTLFNEISANSPADPDPNLFLLDLTFVAPPSQNRGIGTKTRALAIQEVFDKDPSAIILTVLDAENKRIVQMSEKAGFKKTKIRVFHGPNPNHYWWIDKARFEQNSPIDPNNKPIRKSYPPPHKTQVRLRANTQ